MTEYRRRKGNEIPGIGADNCSNDPKSDYDIRWTRPDNDLCEQCKVKE
jgi:hypothetical protein